MVRPAAGGRCASRPGVHAAARLRSRARRLGSLAGRASPPAAGAGAPGAGLAFYRLIFTHIRPGFLYY